MASRIVKLKLHLEDHNAEYVVGEAGVKRIFQKWMGDDLCYHVDADTFGLTVKAQVGVEATHKDED